MKNIIFAALLGVLALSSCSKKENSNKESNIMIEEPTATVVDTTNKSTTKTATATTTTPTIATDSIATKK